MLNRKVFSIVLVLVVAGLVMAACMNNDSSGVMSTPEPTADYAPGADGNNGAGMNNGSGANNGSGLNAGSGANSGNGANGGTDTSGLTGNGTAGSTDSSANGALAPFDWANGAADTETAISRLSEISEARVVVVDSTALVGVKFDNAYKGQMTERIREMVAAEVLKVDPSIQTVAVTAADEDVRKVYALSDEIRAGRTASERAADINALGRNATTLR